VEAPALNFPEKVFGLGGPGKLGHGQKKGHDGAKKTGLQRYSGKHYKQKPKRPKKASNGFGPA